MKKQFAYFAVSLLLVPLVHAAEEDSPSPQFLKEAATELKEDANKLAKQYQKASIGKQWGRSPGHKALYQAIFAYRNELQTASKMCQPAESPDRLLKVILDSRTLGKRMEFLAKFIIIPDPILQAITNTSQASNTLLPHLQKYEARYFTWKKVELEREHAEDLEKMQQQIAALQRSHNAVVNNSNQILNALEEERSRPDTIIVHPGGHQSCPPSHDNRPVRQPTTRPVRPTRPAPCPPTQPSNPLRRVKGIPQ